MLIGGVVAYIMVAVRDLHQRYIQRIVDDPYWLIVAGGKNDASTANLGYRKGMAVFTVAKGGLMYEAAIAGQKYNYTPK